jgi:diguanylate cyclase
MEAAYRRAAAALGDMQRHRILPSAHAYELWLAYLADRNPALTQRMNDLVGSGRLITPAMVEALWDEFEPDPRHAAKADSREFDFELSDGLHDAAQALVQQAASGRAAIRDYGEVLAKGVYQLGAEPNRDESIRVISMLTTETLKMSEHNRVLREQLTTTSAKVEKLRRMLADEKQAASTDQLTGLANRRAFNTRVKRALGKLATESQAPSSLLLLDVDNFKQFNDLYGHSTGDLVLRLVGRLLIESIKGRDIAARYGGEEFGILLIGAEINAAAHVARQICASLASKRFKVSGGKESGQGRVTISIGVAQLRITDSLASVIDRADAALYAAKHAGRNRVLTEGESMAGVA